MMTSPPLPPSPPEGPPRGTNISRRNARQPLPPSPAFTRIVASSMNMEHNRKNDLTMGSRKGYEHGLRLRLAEIAVPRVLHTPAYYCDARRACRGRATSPNTD